MKKRIFFLLVVLSSLLVACSGGNNENSDGDYAEDSGGNAEYQAEYETMDMASDDSGGTSEESQNKVEQPTTPDLDAANNIQRKIIYEADLELEVKNYNNAINEVQSQVEERNGYVVESRTYGGNQDLKEGMIKVRVPQESFHDFIKVVEEGSMKVVGKTVTGNDVTEEYIDLESRLKSKRVVEERLTSFMEKAEKTEDLLKISDDLAQVQEEIEEVTGRMKYLDNKSDLATVTIHFYENRVIEQSVPKEDLDTWEETKQQFTESINFLLSALSGLTVFFIGNLPILLVLGIVGLIIFWIVRKQMKKETALKKESDRKKE